MLHDFLTAHRSDLIDRCKAKIARKHGIPAFLEQLIETLRLEQTREPMQSRKVSGPAGGGGGKTASSEIGVTAALHGRELLRHGFTIDQVVHDYGDLCQAITDLAFERGAPFQVDEFRTLNRCLDNAIADAVTEFNHQRDTVLAAKGDQALNQRLGFLAHELRNLIHTATLALRALRTGNVGLAGATGAVLDRSLVGLRSLIDHSLADVRMTAGMPACRQLSSLSSLVAEAKSSASLEAQARGAGLRLASSTRRSQCTSSGTSRKRCSCRSNRPVPTSPASGLDCPSHGAVSRRMTAFSR